MKHNNHIIKHYRETPELKYAFNGVFVMKLSIYWHSISVALIKSKKNCAVSIYILGLRKLAFNLIRDKDSQMRKAPV